MSPKRRKKSAPADARLLLLLFAGAVILFFGGELVRYVRSDPGAVFMSRVFGISDRARLTQIFSRHVRRGLAAVNVPRDSVREEPGRTAASAVRWWIGIAPEASLFQANLAITEAVTQGGGHVFSGRERPTVRGGSEVVLVVGVGRERTHELILTRGPRPEEKSEAHAARFAFVLFGFGDDVALAKRLFALPRPFAVAVPPDGKSSAALYRDAHDRGREVVLHLPLEPINYPQVSPGPGAILVTMKPARIAGEIRREIEQARPVVAVANLMGSLATQDMTVMTAIYEELRRERLPFIHLAPVAGAVCRPLASQLGVIYQEPDLVLDGEAREAKPAALDRQWRALIEKTPPGGTRVIWLRATETSRAWMEKSLDPKRLNGVSLVPLSAVLRRPSEL